MEIHTLLSEVIRYTDPKHTKRLASEYLDFKKVDYTYYRDENQTIYAIAFDSYVLDLETHEIYEIH